MHDQERIGNAFRRNARAIERMPSIGQGTAVTRVRLKKNLACEVEEGSWRFSVDMSEKSGGDNTAPNPGIYGRGTLGACLAVGYMMWASAEGVPIHDLEVEIQADYDARPEYGVSDHSEGYREIRYKVTVESDAPEEEVRAVLDRAEAGSTYLQLFKRPQNLKRELSIVAPARTS